MNQFPSNHFFGSNIEVLNVKYAMLIFGIQASSPHLEAYRYRKTFTWRAGGLNANVIVSIL